MLKVNTGMNISLNIHHFYSLRGIYISDNADKRQATGGHISLKQRICILLAGIICLGLNLWNSNGTAAPSDGEAVTAYLDASASAAGSDNGIYAEGNIKYIEFTPTAAALRAASDYDIKTHGTEKFISWIDLLAVWAAKNGGSFDGFGVKKMNELAEKILSAGAANAAGNTKLYDYYREAYGAVLGGMLGDYAAVSRAEDGSETTESLYGVRAFSPLASLSLIHI